MLEDGNVEKIRLWFPVSPTKLADIIQKFPRVVHGNFIREKRSFLLDY